MANARDGRVRAEVLGREIAPGGPRHDHETAPAILGDEGREGRGAGLSRRAGTPARGRDRAGVDRLDGRVEQVDAFQKERPLLGIEECESRVHGELRDVGFDLGEVGVDRPVDREACARRPLHVDPGVELRGLVHEAGRRVGRVAGHARLFRSDERGRDEVGRRGKSGDPGHLPGPADEAIAAARDRARMNGVPVLARVVPPDEDSPRLRVRLRVPERRERDPELGLPPLGRHAGGRVVEEVRGEVLVPVRVVEHGVALDPARVHPQLHGRPPVVPGVEQDRDVVVGTDDVVPVHVRGPDLPRLRVVALHRDVEVPVVVRHPGRRLHLRRHVVARIGFPEHVDDRGTFPARVPEIAVYGHRAGGPRHGNRRRKTRLRPGRQGSDRRATGRRGPDGFSAWKATPVGIRAGPVEVPARYRPSCGGTRRFVACSNA